MFHQFRQQYPQGSITSNLVKIHGDQYIVSVSVANDSLILVTTLAADAQIEVAEARARQRAMQVLGFGSTEPELVTLSSPASAPAQPAETDVQPPAAATIVPRSTDLFSSVQNIIGQSNPVESLPVPEPVITSIPAQVQESTTLDYQVENDQVDTLAAAASDSPLSVTDMIPLINMELKRLNWSREKGRDCIIALYNKRSSSLLSDEELLGLLRHLQAQTNPD